MVEPYSLRPEVQAPASSGTLASEQWSLCCLSSMLIIDKESFTWLTKHGWLPTHISEPEDHQFLVAQRVLLKLDHHDSGIILALFSVWNSLSCVLKDQQGFDAKTDTTRPDHWHPEPTHVAVKTWNWIDEFCLLCLSVLILIYGILLQYCCQYLSLLPSFYETQSIRVEGKQNVFLFCCSFKFREKKLTSALFENDFCSPKVTAPLKLRPPKAANSERNEGRCYRNSSLIGKKNC